jgi:polysaccharide chain length determinant protein (PEP-CTERM system associated)
MEERSVHLFDYLAVVRRRRGWLVVPVLLAIAVGAGLALTLPRTYRSYTTLAVTTPSLASDLVRSAPSDLEERVRAISHDLLSRPNLERVAREEGLADDSSLDAVVSAIRSRTSVSLPKAIAPTGRTGPDTFVVTYIGPTPESTQSVTNRLATVFIETNSKVRAARAEDTSAFLATQLSQSQTRLRAVEEKLRLLKEAHMGRLPEQMQANLQMVGGLRQQQDNTALSLRSEQDRLSMIEQQIEAMKQGAADAPSAKTPGEPTAAERLATLRSQLKEAQTMYTEKHPDIQRLRGDIASAEAAAKLEGSRPASERAPALNRDPVYQRLLADRETSRLRIKELDRVNSRASAEIARYQGRVDSAPMIEQQLSSLTREYDLEKQQYNALAERHQAALIAEDLERRRAGAQFAVLYPAFLPTEPDSPKVFRLMVLAVLAGVALGVALALGREYVDRSVHDARALEQAFDVPVLAEIPRIAAR